MAINNEQAGERVFGNVDEALAERIVSRAKENSKEPERSAYDTAPGRVDTDRVNTDKPKQRPGSIIKMMIPVVLILITMWFLIRRGRR